MRGNRALGFLTAIALIGVQQSESRASICAADLCVRLEPAELMIVEGGDFSVDIVADINTPVIGWGFDLAATPAFLLALDGPPTIGPQWSPAGSSDGDDLAGLAFPNAVSGTDILLATVHLQAIAQGKVELTIETTIGDLTEGFALDPSGFASFTVTPANITIIPEPATAALLVLVPVIGLFRSRRRRTISESRNLL